MVILFTGMPLPPPLHCVCVKHCFITGDTFVTHHCPVHKKVCWSAEQTEGSGIVCGLSVKTSLEKLPTYLCSLITFNYNTCNVRSQGILTLSVPLLHSELGKHDFRTFQFHSNLLKRCTSVLTIMLANLFLNVYLWIMCVYMCKLLVHRSLLKNRLISHWDYLFK